MAVPDVTRRITASAKLWMLSAGFKPVEEEVPVSNGWIADLSGYVYPTPTELKKTLKLHRLTMDAPKIGQENDLVAAFFAKYDMPLTAICEVKISKADYRKDLGRKYGSANSYMSHPGHLAYLALPVDIIEESELPWYWGKLIFDETGNKLLKVETPRDISAQHAYQTAQLIAAVGERCFNKWHHREERELAKAINAERTEDRQRLRITGLLDMFHNHLSGARPHDERSLATKMADETRRTLTGYQIQLCDEIDKLVGCIGRTRSDSEVA